MVAGKVPAVIVQGAKRAKGSLSVTVRNESGVAFNGLTDVAVLASGDGIADVGDAIVAQSSKRLKLKIGQSRSVRLVLPMATLPVGTYQLLGAATTNDLTSFAAGPAVSVETPVVHLVGAGSAPPPGKPIRADGRATLLVPLRNDGNVSTSNMPATYTLIVSTDGTEAGGIHQTTATVRTKLKPGQAKQQKVNVRFAPGAFPAGTYTILVKLDADLNDTNGQLIATLPATSAD
jgi:hypothetical protein